jgi:hypothetical protein
MKRIDPETYRKMSEPFENPEAANAALSAFQGELYELRLKHRIKDLAFVCEINISHGENGERPAIVSNGYGDSMRLPVLLAYALGEAETRSRAAISEYTAVGRRAARAQLERDDKE